MSSRHRDRQWERRGRSRSPNGEQRDRKHGRHDRSGEKSTSKSNIDGEKREDRRRMENDQRNGQEHRAVRRSPERKRRGQNTSYRDGKRREERRRQEESDRQNGEEQRPGHRFDERKHQQNMDIAEEGASQTKEEPNFELSGKLTEYTNTYKGVVIKYNEPPEALKPKTRWRLYPFKDDKELSVMYIHRQSAYLIGRQRHIVDLAVDHPSCSKQHAVLQYRLVNYEREDGTTGRKCKPYIIDLESANGTFLNNQKIEARRYYELKEKDVLKFGFSTREYVLLNEKSKVSEADEDDISEEAET